MGGCVANVRRHGKCLTFVCVMHGDSNESSAVTFSSSVFDHKTSLLAFPAGKRSIAMGETFCFDVRRCYLNSAAVRLCVERWEPHQGEELRVQMTPPERLMARSAGKAVGAGWVSCPLCRSLRKFSRGLGLRNHLDMAHVVERDAALLAGASADAWHEEMAGNALEHGISLRRSAACSRPVGRYYGSM